MSVKLRARLPLTRTRSKCARPRKCALIGEQRALVADVRTCAWGPAGTVEVEPAFRPTEPWPVSTVLDLVRAPRYRGWMQVPLSVSGTAKLIGPITTTTTVSMVELQFPSWKSPRTTAAPPPATGPAG
jgi:hypothetical protein